jgi:chemotaxis protein CheX
MMDESAIVNGLQEATEEVFSTMLALEVVFGESYTEINPMGQSEAIIAVIGLAGEWIGTASICCSAAMGCRMASQMLATEFAEVNEEVLDAISEVANMIIGCFKTAAEDHLGPLGLSIPTVIYGLSFSARSPGRERWIVVPLSCGDDTVKVKICLTPNRSLPRLGSLGSVHLAHR